MQDQAQNANNQSAPILVIAGTGKTGRRVADRLEAMGRPVRRGSRSSGTPFDWNERATWRPALEGVQAAYVVYSPDLAVPEAPEAISAFTGLARELGVQRLVLLSGRGEEEAQRCEGIVQQSGLEWTVVRASWFAQNFNEGAFLDLVLSGEVTLPADEVREPFIDIDDIADTVVAALTSDDHVGEVYEVTGPRLFRSIFKIYHPPVNVQGNSSHCCKCNIMCFVVKHLYFLYKNRSICWHQQMLLAKCAVLQRRAANNLAE
ncbi:MAG: NmrA family transcriptional regulator [Planctomycetota bacterium]